MTLPLQPRGNLKKYQSSNPLQQFFIRAFLKTIENFTDKLPPGPLLEIGCGEGFVLKHLTARQLLQGRKIFAIDADTGALRFAYSSVPEVQFAAASAYALPFQNKSFQSVIMLEVLEHLNDPGKALQEARRLSHSAVLSVPHEPWFQAGNFLRGKNLKLLGNDPEHIQHWGISSLRRLLHPYGTLKAFETPFPWMVAHLEFN